MLRLELLEKDQEVRCSGDQSQTLEILEKPVEWANGVIIVAVLSLSHVTIFVTLWTATHQASLSFTISQNLLKLMCIKSVIPFNYLILCHPLLLLPSTLPSINLFQ